MPFCYPGCVCLYVRLRFRRHFVAFPFHFRFLRARVLLNKVRRTASRTFFRKFFLCRNLLYFSLFAYSLQKTFEKKCPMSCSFWKSLYLCTRFPEGTPPERGCNGKGSDVLWDYLDRNNVVRFKERKRGVNSRDEREPVDRIHLKEKRYSTMKSLILAQDER